MPIPGTQMLQDLVRGVRAESGKSLNVALGVAERDAIVYQLQLKQEWLYYEYDWQSLIDQEAVPLAAGTRYYAFPASIAYDFVNEVWCSEDNATSFSPVRYGIGPPEFNESGAGTTGWPVCRWMLNGDQPGAQRIETWPVPSQAGYLRVIGRRALSPMVADSDYSTLNGTVLVLYVAADILARQKAEDAQVKLAQATKHMRNLARRQGANKQSPIVLGGGSPDSARRTPNRNLLWAPGA